MLRRTAAAWAPARPFLLWDGPGSVVALGSPLAALGNSGGNVAAPVRGPSAVINPKIANSRFYCSPLLVVCRWVTEGSPGKRGWRGDDVFVMTVIIMTIGWDDGDGDVSVMIEIMKGLNNSNDDKYYNCSFTICCDAKDHSYCQRRLLLSFNIARREERNRIPLYGTEDCVHGFLARWTKRGKKGEATTVSQHCQPK